MVGYPRDEGSDDTSDIGGHVDARAAKGGESGSGNAKSATAPPKRGDLVRASKSEVRQLVQEAARKLSDTFLAILEQAAPRHVAHVAHCLTRVGCFDAPRILQLLDSYLAAS